MRARALARGEKSSCFRSPILTSVALPPLLSLPRWRSVRLLHLSPRCLPLLLLPLSLTFSACRTAPRTVSHASTCTVTRHRTRVDTARRTAETHVSSSSCFAASSSCRRFRCDLCGKHGVMGNLVLIAAENDDERRLLDDTRRERTRLYAVLRTRTRPRKSVTNREETIAREIADRDAEILARSIQKTERSFRVYLPIREVSRASTSNILRYSLTRLLSLFMRGVFIYISFLYFIMFMMYRSLCSLYYVMFIFT